MRFEFRLEMSRPFVLSELRRFLFVVQNRLEMRFARSKMRFEFRLEMSRPFVLSELRRFLFVVQFRLEMRRIAAGQRRQERFAAHEETQKHERGLVQSSRLGRAAFVCYQRVGSCSYLMSSRLEMRGSSIGGAQ
jgi:hypothetical protein